MKTIRIENSGHEPQIINVPDGAKVIIEDGLTEKYVPETGDCVKRELSTKTIFGVLDKDFDCRTCIIVYKNGQASEIKDCWVCMDRNFTQITPEELQSEFNKLGYEYDFETHEAKKMRWKPEINDIYYFVEGSGKISETKKSNFSDDLKRIEIGNCYRTAEEAEPRRQHYLSFKD